jgi:hypothetical protein
MGWPEEAFDLLVRLDGDPSAAALERWREEHDRLVRRPMRKLRDLIGASARDDRVTLSGRGADPETWQQTSVAVWLAPRVRLAVRLDRDGLFAEGGWSGGSTAHLWGYRAAVDADHSGCELVQLVDDLLGAGYTLTEGRLTRISSGYHADHPRATLLYRRKVILERDLGLGPWPDPADLVDEVQAAFAPLLPLTSWFADYVAIHR